MNDLLFQMHLQIVTMVLLILVLPFLMILILHPGFSPRRGLFATLKSKRREKRKQRIKETSKWYQAVLALNEGIHYYDHVLDQGNGEHYLSVNSKAKFDRTTTDTCFAEFVEQHRHLLTEALEQTRRNAVIYDMYSRKIMTLRVEVSGEQCKEAKMTKEEYMELEREVISEAELPIQRTYSVTCHVYYISPQGRNHYQKSHTYREGDISAEIMRQEQKTACHASEAWRRKTERSRVTPSVRYRIMEHDGFRCRICGRSASSGVELEVDHIIPISRGGSSNDDNLQTLCRDCNRGKGASY